MPFCYDSCPENTAAPNLAQIVGNHKLKYHYYFALICKEPPRTLRRVARASKNIVPTGLALRKN